MSVPDPAASAPLQQQVVGAAACEPPCSMAADPAAYAPPLRPPAPALAKLSLPLPQSCHSSAEEAAGSGEAAAAAANSLLE